MTHYDKIRPMLDRSIIAVLLLIFSLLIPAGSEAYTQGMVIDFFTGKPIKGAFVALNNETTVTDDKGAFLLKATGNKITVRAYGYLRAEQLITASPIGSAPAIKLIPFTPKALYLSFYGIGSRAIRDPALKLIEETELNALVIDVKGDRGMIIYKSSIPLASEIGAQKIITVKDIDELLRSLKERGIYTIARIVVFKDNLLADAKPELAIKTKAGQIWRDREDLAWTDPFKKEAWEYNIEIAVEAAKHGFDEIQFDYVRFPDTGSPVFSSPSTEENRVKAISGFLSEAKKRLMPYNVFLSADIFGYVCWNLNDTQIGQRLEDLSLIVDYLSPMLYPSGFQFGIPGYRNPVAHSYEIVNLTLKKAAERSNLDPIRFRPWLQSFDDYAFDKRHFSGQEIREQINASDNFGSNGWMLWNPHNVYSHSGLKEEDKKK